LYKIESYDYLLREDLFAPTYNNLRWHWRGCCNFLQVIAARVLSVAKEYFAEVLSHAGAHLCFLYGNEGFVENRMVATTVQLISAVHNSMEIERNEKIMPGIIIDILTLKA